MTRILGYSTLMCLLVGCSTHPCADFSDYFFPGKLGRNEVQPYGGVCVPQSPIGIPAPTTLPMMGTPVPFAPGPPVIPPPLALPGARPPGDIQLQAPFPGGIPPLPPDPPGKFGL